MESILHIRNKLHSLSFMEKHKASIAAFSRVRKLTFATMFILILRNSVKSLQLMLNEFTLDTNKDLSITAGAFTKARKKLKHTAYIELNDDIVNIYYKNNDIKRLRGYRILACDGSKIVLPKTEEIKSEFGSKSIGNYMGKDFGEYTSATFQASYDVLNNICVSASLGAGTSYEVNLAENMLDSFDGNDLLIYDRGYASYHFMATLLAKGLQFIIRCPRGTISAIQTMFADDAPPTKTLLIDVPRKQKRRVRERGLPSTIKIKLIRIILPTGEVEVLATSLLSDAEFEHNEFKHLYSLRWGVETFFSKLKSRLGLENFTGKTVESIKQDVWSTVFISNLETIMVEDLEENINVKEPNKSKKMINKSVSFNAIKNMAFEIFLDEPDPGLLFERLNKLFRMNPITVREGRKVPRKKTSDTQSFNFQKRIRKHVF